jgi:DNA-binding transcriptional ArsR family regulator
MELRPMLKVKLSTADLSGVRFAISPINQTVLYAAWRPTRYASLVGAPADLSGVATRDGAAALLLQLLATKVGDRPDFLTPPPGQSGDLDAELAAVRATPPSLLADELKSYHFHPKMRDLLALADGSERIKNRVADGLHQVHRTVFGRDWDDAKAALRADIARRTAELGYCGLDHVLSRLHSRVSYSDGVLTLHSPRTDPDVIGAGKGLVLVPTIVPTRSIAIKINPHDPIVLIYPVDNGDRLAGTAPALLPIEQRLARVVGHGRASVLLALSSAVQLSTSEIAKRSGIAVSSASEHATVLREAGLIDSHRERNKMLHSLTDIGSQLAQGNTSPPRQRTHPGRVDYGSRHETG